MLNHPFISKLFLTITLSLASFIPRAQNPNQSNLVRPISVYVNWAAYDELSDTVRLTQALAKKQLKALLQMKAAGVQFDYYLMDAFWFDKNGSFRIWQKDNWPDGFTAWVKTLQQQDIKPGLWFSVNYIFPAGKYILHATDTAWKSSLSHDGKGLCLFDGGYLSHFMETLDFYARSGFKLFKFDFFDMNAVTKGYADKLTKEEIRRANFKALRFALNKFREQHPDVLLIAYNGFGGEISNTGVAISQTVEKEWLDVFDAMYCGDPRPADVPAANFWRSKDIYSDHMVRYWMANGFPIKQIDNAGFMIGNTGTCYYRGKAAWKGMLLLSLSRGGWMNTYYGDMTLLTREESHWFGRAQQMWYPLQLKNTTVTFGGIPGKGEPYGYLSKGKNGALLTVLNPSSARRKIVLPDAGFSKRKILFNDAGFRPRLTSNRIELGPEQVAVIGYGYYASDHFSLGEGDNIRIAENIKPLNVPWVQSGNCTKATWIPTERKTIRLVFQQFDTNGIPFRTTGGSPPEGTRLTELLVITATQKGKSLPLQLQYDKAIWSGLSWAVAEINPTDFLIGEPIQIQFTSVEKQPLTIKGEVFSVDYSNNK